MEFAFPWPVTQGEWLAWVSAAVTVLLRRHPALRAGHLLPAVPAADRSPSIPEAYAAARANMAGFYLGLGLCCLLLGPAAALHGARLFLAVHRFRPHRLDDVGPRNTVLPTGSGWSSTSCFRRWRSPSRWASFPDSEAGCAGFAGGATKVPETPVRQRVAVLGKPVLDGNRLSTGGCGARTLMSKKIQ